MDDAQLEKFGKYWAKKTDDDKKKPDNKDPPKLDVNKINQGYLVN